MAQSLWDRANIELPFGGGAMPDQFSEEGFSSFDDVIQRLRERSDDFERVSIMVANDLPLAGPEGQTALAKNCCSLIETVSGEPVLIHREALEALLNDGILQRLKIPVSLVPFEAR